MPSPSLYSLMRDDIDIERIPIVSGGKSAEAEAHLSNVRCTPMLPLSNETAIRAGLDSPAGRWVVYVPLDTDVRGGDIVVMRGKRYPVKVASPYQAIRHERGVIELIVEAIKTERR